MTGRFRGLPGLSILASLVALATLAALPHAADGAPRRSTSRYTIRLARGANNTRVEVRRASTRLGRLVFTLADPVNGRRVYGRRVVGQRLLLLTTTGLSIYTLPRLRRIYSGGHWGGDGRSVLDYFIAFSPNKRFAAVSGVWRAREVTVVRVRDGKVVLSAKLPGPAKGRPAATWCEFSRDGKRFVASDGATLVYDALTWRRLAAFDDGAIVASSKTPPSMRLAGARLVIEGQSTTRCREMRHGKRVPCKRQRQP